MEVFVIEFTQFLLPNGRQEKIYLPLANSTEEFRQKVAAILSAGFRFEIEMLRNGMVSATISDDYGDWEYSITPNGPEVPDGIISMIQAFDIALAQSLSAAEKGDIQ
jgi:hypothetical protein